MCADIELICAEKQDVCEDTRKARAYMGFENIIDHFSHVILAAHLHPWAICAPKFWFSDAESEL
jgi:hypothetical protein